MAKYPICVNLKDGEIIFNEDGTAIYNDYTYSRKRSAILRRAKDMCDHTKEEWLNLVSEYFGLCCKCGGDVIGGIPTKDHIIPLIYGGTNSIGNVQPLCRECNISKGHDLTDYRNG